MGVELQLDSVLAGVDTNRISVEIQATVGGAITITTTVSDFNRISILVVVGTGAGSVASAINADAQASLYVTASGPMDGSTVTASAGSVSLSGGSSGQGVGQYYAAAPAPPAPPASIPPPGTRGSRHPPQILLNFHDLCLARNFNLLDRIDPRVLGCQRPPVCYGPEDSDYDDGEANRSDYLSMPANGAPFLIVKSVPLPDPTDGNVDVISGQVPIGYDGRVTGYFHLYTGPNFVEASGDLIWRVRLNLYYVRNMGNMLTTQGSSINLTPAEGGPRIFSGQFFKYQVNAPNTSGALPGPGVGNIICGLRGYYYPRK